MLRVDISGKNDQKIMVLDIYAVEDKDSLKAYEALDVEESAKGALLDKYEMQDNAIRTRNSGDNT
jgi:hypothetical protein